MPIFSSSESAEHVFGELFQILSQDEEFSTRMTDGALSARLVHTKPDCIVFISPDGVLMGADAPAEAVITIRMSCDTADALWRGALMMPTAIATGKVRIRGKVAKVLELVPILQPAFDRYPAIAAANGIAS